MQLQTSCNCGDREICISQQNMYLSARRTCLHDCKDTTDLASLKLRQRLTGFHQRQISLRVFLANQMIDYLMSSLFSGTTTDINDFPLVHFLFGKPTESSPVTSQTSSHKSCRSTSQLITSNLSNKIGPEDPEVMSPLSQSVAITTNLIKYCHD